MTRRTALGVLGTSAIGLGATGVTNAEEHDGFTIEDSGPNPDPLVTAEGNEWPEDPADGMELFDAEPEFPPFTNFEGMKEQYNPGAVNKYLQKHGDPNLLSSRRLVVWPNAEEDGAATWGEFSRATATASVESVAPGRGGGEGQARSEVRIDFEGLYPDGVYTVWVVHAPGEHRPLGGNDGQNNYFTADGHGEYTLETVDQPSELTLPPGESGGEIPVTQHPLHEIPGDFFFVVAYHYDNRTWDSQPGPYWVPQLVINDFDSE